MPNDCSLTSSTNMLVVSGPNGSGKTVFIKQVGPQTANPALIIVITIIIVIIVIIIIVVYP